MIGLRSIAGALSGLGSRREEAGGIPTLLMRGEPVGPDFICIGAQKGGTRWLFDQLNHHPDFWMPAIKELHYFNENIHLNWAKPLLRDMASSPDRVNRHRLRNSMRALDAVDVEWLKALIWLEGKPIDLDAYARLFSPKGKLLSGDVTPTYSIIDATKVDAVLARFPSAKLVYLAREPIERFWSQYCMLVRQNRWQNPESLETVEEFLKTGSGRRHSSILEVLGRWRRPDTEKRFGLYFLDELKADATDLRRRVIAFLGGDPEKPSGDLKPGFNRKNNDPKVVMSDTVRTRLIEIFGPEIKACAATLGGPAVKWPAKYGI